MKALIEIKPTPEQLALFSRIRPGVEVIRGAAGSGKTTTAILKLRTAVAFYINRMKRQANKSPIRVLVLTFNRTLRGYIAELTERQFEQSDQITLEISTFAGWSKGLLGMNDIMSPEDVSNAMLSFDTGLKLSDDFILEEVQYVLGRFLPANLTDYLAARRDGRGSVPRMEKSHREALLHEVIFPYIAYKRDNGLIDWTDLAASLAGNKVSGYDVVVVDETQDLSANEIRAVMNQLNSEHTATFVLDTSQRIYARSGFTWQEVGITIRPDNSHSLSENYRNTKQIARFAAGILSGLNPGEDGAMPNFEAACKEGEVPTVIVGKFSAQMQYAINYIQKHVDLAEESVAFLHPKGGGWFSQVREDLNKANLPFVSLSRKSEWPVGEENIALSTLHSAKGLEFDHVFILGLNGEVMPEADANEGVDDYEPLDRLRRLVAMGVGRARKNVVIGYKASDAPIVASFFDSDTCRTVTL